MAQQLLLLLLCSLDLLLLPAGAQPTTTQELYVKPTEDTSCPEPCYTLDKYVAALQYFVSNTTFNFLPGNHSLSKALNISGISNLSLVAINGTVNITCQGNFPIVFNEISNLTLENLTFYSCPAFDLSDLLNLNFLGGQMEVSPLQEHWDLKATNIFGNSRITGLTMITSLTVSYTDKHSIIKPPSHSVLTVKECTVVTSNVSPESSVVIVFNQTTYPVTLLLENVAVQSMNPNQNDYSKLGFINMLDTQTEHANSLRISKGIFSFCFFDLSLQSTTAIIEDSVFHHSQGRIRSDGSSDNEFLIKNATFSNLLGFSELVSSYDFILEGAVFLINIGNMTVIESNFVRNRGYRALEGNYGGVLLLKDSQSVKFISCEFKENIGTPIVAANSSFTLAGANIFTDNTAYEGGALTFYGSSYVTLANGSNTSFIHNTAERVGGAIYVAYKIQNTCFFAFESNFTCGTTVAMVPGLNLNFEDNTAKDGGNRVYGESLDMCYVSHCIGWKFVSSLFHINVHQEKGSDLSAITSDPTRACLCNDERPNCTAVFNSLAVYPGQTFLVSAAVVGARFGTAAGSVYAQLLPTSSGEIADFGNIQDVQQSEPASCINLSYTILSNSSNVTLALTANPASTRYPGPLEMSQIKCSISDYSRTGGINPYYDNILRLVPVYINVTLLPCPLGFVLSGVPPRCNCDPRLLDNGIDCNLTTQTVQRRGTQWVNASFENYTYNGVVVNKYCPNNYCTQELVNVSLEYSQSQCAFNHSGTLCGGCQSGLSATLGSAQCLSCSNAYLALLIPFALAGFALVFFIKLLNLTVAVGTLNGLIFYANIVRSYEVAWMPHDTTKVLTVFIAWLNLDLGIETCFFDGLTAYGKMWLQFLFPLYVWAIATCIVVMSYYFSTAAKIFGTNSVQVLATLFLLSYPKLIRIIICTFQSSTLEYPDGSSTTVWSYDGNIGYLDREHIPLFVVALAVALFLWLPYTTFLIFTQFLQKIPNYRISRILLKLKPFLDAYFGPFKDKHRYWVGLLLLARGVLFATFAATPNSSSYADFLATVVVVLGLLIYLNYVGNVYKNKYLSLLENSFFLNLCILAGGTLYIESSGGNQSALAYTSVGVAFLQFLTIVGFHAFVVLKGFKMSHKLQRTNSSGTIQSNNGGVKYMELGNEPVKPLVNKYKPPEMVISYSEYREPVLKYLESQN